MGQLANALPRDVMFTPSRSIRYAAIGAAAVVAIGGAAFGSAQAFHSGGSSGKPATVAEPPKPKPVVTAGLERHGRVPWDKPLSLHIDNGHFTGVFVQAADRSILQGTLSGDQSTWHSTTTLVPLTHYAALLSYVDLDGHKTLHEYDVMSADSTNHLEGVLTPGDGAIVGIGEPIVVYFNQWVPENMRATVERRLSVTTSPAVEGAWHWLGGMQAHWRPRSYWAPGTTVTVHENLDKVYIGGGFWGTGAHTAQFHIGAAHISKVDVANHVMRVYNGGVLIRTMPISAGRDKYPTMGGIHIALDKRYMVIMDSATVGIPRNSPDGYYEKVYWNVRITNGGAFVHAAPWSLASQGRRNVSHGCVNVSPSNAEWFMGWSQLGDIIDVFNTPRGPDLWDAGTADWNISWKQWVADDPLHPQFADTNSPTPQPSLQSPSASASSSYSSPSPSPSTSSTVATSPAVRPSSSPTPART